MICPKGTEGKLPPDKLAIPTGSAEYPGNLTGKLLPDFFMWLCSKLGFFSIVKKGTPGTWQVRARANRDLANLISAAKLKADIILTPKADYACRIIVDEIQLGQIFATLANSVDYPNFKDCVARQPDQRGKLPAYHGFWEGMWRFQKDHGRRPPPESGRSIR